ncbi:MAG: hypothetical protein M0R80_07850 [Proteobacteria bacterium]|jgi:hypothetical protein|nr:hypothetical protein [Pseudomonadota bacterium]
MKKPQKPFQPFHYDYEEKIVKRYIYRFTESLCEDECWDESELDDDEEKPEVPLKPIGEVDLAWLVSLVPEGIKPEQIKIDFGYNASSMSYEDHYVGFYYEVTVPARDAEFDAAMREYKAAERQYEADMTEYEVWAYKQEIKETEEKLARLKGQNDNPK